MTLILAGVDGSPEAKAAAEFAAGLAQREGAELLLAFFVQTRVAPEPTAMLEPVEAMEREFGAQVLREMKARCERPDLKISTALELGAPAPGLADLAREKNAALVVVGHRGRGKVTRLLLGSVADHLVQISSRPVLVHR
jgi:nucleotide-binding universal stress UspA family protein